VISPGSLLMRDMKIPCLRVSCLYENRSSLLLFEKARHYCSPGEQPAFFSAFFPSRSTDSGYPFWRQLPIAALLSLWASPSKSMIILDLSF
jgi:hypothetical protein